MLLDKFFKEAVIHKKELIKGFHLIYVLIFAALLISAISSYFDIFRAAIYPFGVLSGQLAVIFFCLCILPGIARRFGMRNNLMAFLMLIRRQLGVLSFAFSFLHYSTIRLFSVLFGERELVLPLPIYELLGVGALYAMVPLFLTSNDLSVKKLKRWWHRIHAMIYFIVWLLFAHVALQGISPATVILFIFAFLEVFSLAYFAAKNYVKK